MCGVMMIDVPLFLPIYGAKRLQDLRTIAREEQSKGWKMSGQMNFDSGIHMHMLSFDDPRTCVATIDEQVGNGEVGCKI
jgi:hypothetical protein